VTAFESAHQKQTSSLKHDPKIPAENGALVSSGADRTMILQSNLGRTYTCGQHVTGHGRQILASGEAIPWRKECVFEKGVIVKLPGNSGEPYAVLDEQTFNVLEAKEEHLTPLS
jgi:hypothetical protein